LITCFYFLLCYCNIIYLDWQACLLFWYVYQTFFLLVKDGSYPSYFLISFYIYICIVSLRWHTDSTNWLMLTGPRQLPSRRVSPMDLPSYFFILNFHCIYHCWNEVVNSTTTTTKISVLLWDHDSVMCWRFSQNSYSLVLTIFITMEAFLLNCYVQKQIRLDQTTSNFVSFYYLGLIVRLRFPPGDRNSLKPACGLGHGMWFQWCNINCLSL